MRLHSIVSEVSSTETFRYFSNLKREYIGIALTALTSNCPTCSRLHYLSVSLPLTFLYDKKERPFQKTKESRIWANKLWDSPPVKSGQNFEDFLVSGKNLQIGDVITEGRFAIIRKGFLTTGNEKNPVAIKALRSKAPFNSSLRGDCMNYCHAICVYRTVILERCDNERYNVRWVDGSWNEISGFSVVYNDRLTTLNSFICAFIHFFGISPSLLEFAISFARSFITSFIHSLINLFVQDIYVETLYGVAWNAAADSRVQFERLFSRWIWQGRSRGYEVEGRLYG